MYEPVDAWASFADLWIDRSTNCKDVNFVDHDPITVSEIFARAPVSRLFTKLSEVARSRSPRAKIHFLQTLCPLDPVQEEGSVPRARYSRVMYRRVAREIQKLSPADPVEVPIPILQYSTNKKPSFRFELIKWTRMVSMYPATPLILYTIHCTML